VKQEKKKRKKRKDFKRSRKISEPVREGEGVEGENGWPF